MHDAGYDQEAQQLQQHLQQVQSDPKAEMQVWRSVVAQSPKQQQLAIEAVTANARKTAADKPTEASLAAAAAGGDQDAQGALNKLSEQKGQVTPALQYAQSQENYRATLSRQASTANELQKQGISNLQKTERYIQSIPKHGKLPQELAFRCAEWKTEMAAAVAPLQGTLFVTTAEGVKRINNTELQGVEGAGSLVQRINGELGKQTGKGPLSDQLKQDMASARRSATRHRSTTHTRIRLATPRSCTASILRRHRFSTRAGISRAVKAGTGDTVRVRISGPSAWDNSAQRAQAVPAGKSRRAGAPVMAPTATPAASLANQQDPYAKYGGSVSG